MSVMEDWRRWEDYKRDLHAMRARHEEERREMFYRQREESESLTGGYLDAVRAGKAEKPPVAAP